MQSMRDLEQNLQIQCAVPALICYIDNVRTLRWKLQYHAGP